MQVCLSQQSEAIITQRVSSGINKSADETIDEALAMLATAENETNKKLAWMRKAIQEGLDSGECSPWDPSEVERVAEEMMAKGELD